MNNQSHNKDDKLRIGETSSSLRCCRWNIRSKPDHSYTAVVVVRWCVVDETPPFTSYSMNYITIDWPACRASPSFLISLSRFSSFSALILVLLKNHLFFSLSLPFYSCSYIHLQRCWREKKENDRDAGQEKQEDEALSNKTIDERETGRARKRRTCNTLHYWWLVDVYGWTRVLDRRLDRLLF